MRSECQQLGFDALLSSAQSENDLRRQERETAHLPGNMAEGLPYYRELIQRHHEAMLGSDIEKALALRGEANLLAEKLNNFERGILADENAPGWVLERETAAPTGQVPLWGQNGTFEIISGGMRVLIELDGMFGIGAEFMTWLGFSAHAVEWDRPFLSETGYRSFIGLSGELRNGETPEAFVSRIIGARVARELKGRLKVIEEKYRQSG